MARNGFLLVDSFHIFLSKTPGGLNKISIFVGSLHGEIGWRSLCFALCLFVYYLFIFWKCVCLLFIYFKGAVCWVMHQCCGLVLWGKGCEGLFLWICVAVLVGATLAYFVLLWVWCRMWWTPFLLLKLIVITVHTYLNC